MATRELSLFADLDQGRLVQSFLSTLQATLPRFVFGDSIPVSFRPLKSNGNNAGNPWSEVDLTGKTVRIAIGNPAGAPSSGTFSLAYDGDTTAAIAYNADGAAIQSALNAIASIIAAGGVTVTKSANGVIRIVFDDDGVRTAITANTAALYPTSGAEIRVAIEGGVSAREIVVVRMETIPAAYAELADEFPVAAVAITEVREGSVSVGAILSLDFSVLPYSGFYVLTIGGEQTLGIPWDADASTLQAALISLSTVSAGMVTVSGEFPLFTLNFDVSLGDIGAMTIDMTGLVVPRGRAGVLNTNTAGMIELLNGAAQATAKLEIELLDDIDGTTWTVYQGECTVIDDVIGNSPSSETGGPVYATVPYVDSQLGIGATAASKETPVDTDEIPLADSAAGWALKKLTWLNLKLTLKAYLDSLYADVDDPTALTFAGSDPNTGGPTGTHDGQPLRCTGTTPDTWWKWLTDTWLLETETTETILDKLKGAEADPDRIGAEHLPVAITPDYITLTDQAAGTIPAYSLGRKGETPYFGDSPLVSGVYRHFSETLATAASPNRVELAEFPIAAESMVDAARFYLDLELVLDFLTGAVAAEDVWIQIDFAGQAAFALGESIITACGATQLQSFKIQGVIELNESAGDISFNGTSFKGNALLSAYADTLATSIKGKVLTSTEIQDLGVLPVPELVATSLKVWVYNNTWAAANSVTITGKATLTSI